MSGKQLKTAIADLVRNMSGVHIQFRANIAAEAANVLTPEEAYHLLYITQEAMSNTLRHAGARTGLISLRLQDQAVCFEMKDDGKGFNVAAPSKDSQGLRNIAARADKLGARLEIASEPGSGTRIMLEIPKIGGNARGRG
jgi:signal transduction histidine kinase